MFIFFSADMDFCKLHRFLHAGTVQALCAGTMQALCRHYAGTMPTLKVQSGGSLDGRRPKIITFISICY